MARILIVDDEPAALKVLTRLLAEHGCEARVAGTGPQALQAARDSPPDLVLLDINLPEMDGYEICARLKADENMREIPVIFLSGLGETLDKVKAFGCGGVDYVGKPFSPVEVVTRVKTHLELSAQRRRAHACYLPHETPRSLLRLAHGKAPLTCLRWSKHWLS